MIPQEGFVSLRQPRVSLSGPRGRWHDPAVLGIARSSRGTRGTWSAAAEELRRAAELRLREALIARATMHSVVEPHSRAIVAAHCLPLLTLSRRDTRVGRPAR